MSHHFYGLGLKVIMLKNMVSPASVAKTMWTTLAEWYLTDARHHGEGAGPSLSDIQGDYWEIWARISAQLLIFDRAKPLHVAHVGPFMEKTQVFGCKRTGLSSAIDRGINLVDWSTGWCARPVFVQVAQELGGDPRRAPNLGTSRSR